MGYRSDMNFEMLITRELDDIWQFWNSAHAELLPGNGNAGSSSGERTIGVNVSALSFIAGDDIIGTLHEWEKLIRGDRNLTPPAMMPKLPVAEEINAAINFAKTHAKWSSQQPWVDDYYREINELHKIGKIASRFQAEKTQRITCPADFEENRCGQILKIVDLGQSIKCRKCKTEWTVARLMAVAMTDSQNEVWLDVEAIAEYLDLTEKSIYQIIRKHQIARRGQLYNFKQILDTRRLSA